MKIDQEKLDQAEGSIGVWSYNFLGPLVVASIPEGKGGHGQHVSPRNAQLFVPSRSQHLNLTCTKFPQGQGKAPLYGAPFFLTIGLALHVGLSDTGFDALVHSASLLADVLKASDQLTKEEALASCFMSREHALAAIKIVTDPTSSNIKVNKFCAFTLAHRHQLFLAGTPPAKVIYLPEQSGFGKTTNSSSTKNGSSRKEKNSKEVKDTMDQADRDARSTALQKSRAAFQKIPEADLNEALNFSASAYGYKRIKDRASVCNMLALVTSTSNVAPPEFASPFDVSATGEYLLKGDWKATFPKVAALEKLANHNNSCKHSFHTTGDYFSPPAPLSSSSLSSTFSHTQTVPDALRLPAALTQTLFSGELTACGGASSEAVELTNFNMRALLASGLAAATTPSEIKFFQSNKRRGGAVIGGLYEFIRVSSDKTKVLLRVDGAMTSFYAPEDFAPRIDLTPPVLPEEGATPPVMNSQE